MSLPYKILEEYVFYPDGVGTVKGRITETVGITPVQRHWETSFMDGSKAANHGGQIEAVRKELFNYMENFNSQSAKPNPAY